MPYKQKKCVMCNEEFLPNSSTQVYCLPCGIEHKRECRRKRREDPVWRERERKRIREYARKRSKDPAWRERKLERTREYKRKLREEQSATVGLKILNLALELSNGKETEK